ncbi:MAG TPA: SHOCT domain-containing protein [Nitrososphaeraceae archaeon]|nr:SHOCT domain-containing protein [Nitrososphaeraceae archaeon]
MESISKNEAEQIMLYVKNSMDKIKIESQKQVVELKESLADELLKLANLRDKGILNDEEFLKMKQDLLNKRPD